MPLAGATVAVARPSPPDRTLLWARLAGAGTVVPPTIDEFGATSPVVRASFPEGVFFDFDRDTLRPDAGAVCDLLADSLRRDIPDTQLTIVGHTDAVGSDECNIDLSRRRARSVMQALLVRGVDPAMLSTVAVGRRQPLAPDDTPAGRAQNRRVEFFVSSSLAANLAAIQQVAIQPATMLSDGAVTVLRPSTASEPGGVTLATIGTIAPNDPQSPPQAELPRPDVSPTSPPLQAAPTLAHVAAAPPATPRALAPQYVPRPPGEPLSY